MKSNPLVQIVTLMFIGLLVCLLSFESWNRMVDQADKNLRSSFFDLEKSLKIERESTEAIHNAGDGVDAESKLSEEFFRGMPDHVELQEWTRELSIRVTHRLHRTLCRVGSVLALFPIVILMLTATLLDGMLGRRVKQLRFDYPSPLLHRVSILLITGIITLFALLILSPLPFAPQETILFAIVTGLAIKLHLLHLPKRI